MEWDPVATARHSCPADVVLWRGSTGSGDTIDPDSPADSLETTRVLLQACRDDGVGLLVGVCPWGFEMVTSKSVKHGCAQNWLLRQFGLAFSADTYKPVTAAGQGRGGIPAALQSNADTDIDDQTHATVVLRRLAAAGFGATTPITKTDANVLLLAVNTLAGSGRLASIKMCASLAVPVCVRARALLWARVGADHPGH